MVRGVDHTVTFDRAAWNELRAEHARLGAEHAELVKAAASLPWWNFLARARAYKNAHAIALQATEVFRRAMEMK